MLPLNEHAYQHLQNLIMTGRLSYNQIYSETKLAKALGISRTPFRDAIHRLAQEGYIDIIPSKGFMLHQLTRQDIVETFQIRSALESYCTLQLAKSHDSERARKIFHDLRWIMQMQKQCLDTTQSIPEFCKYDFEFHTTIIQSLENNQFISTFGTYMYRMRKLAEQSLSRPGRMKDTYYEHMAILENMEAGNTQEIYEITLRHMIIPQIINLEEL